MTFNISILGSTRGSHLTTLYQCLSKTITIVDVISNKANAGILEKAKSLHLPHHLISSKETDFEKQLEAQLIKTNTQLLVLLGFMKILSPWFVSRWKNKIINVHPSLLPKHAGLMDLSVHQSVLDHHEKETGCTVHWVTEQVDAGTPIVQKRCSVLPDDTAETLKKRVQGLEVAALIKAIEEIGNKNFHDKPRDML